ncbi:MULTISPECIES: RNA 2',3'-cyclic phosphodiesterase [Thermoactinomyces]|uniref:RNA 2',3'-cyclic phosphodiesterase n=1 Tax=Thermoactinomyces daqus TaxID=1329516 RepID=A0A7W2AHI5_9BACL|nr:MULTISPECIES: RNA 2',3'-cyclic phosphodiesterase [Thermoactinomyces]MBA4542761.1 RNA 2',3'-cyclic phosphodiesterase [Thermoactinomyces daqus]MBH8598566.1 RNA 2',3'-cyclic phosphodiesterase [Thermoactinomyces sp. CICC 10523]MBH8604590.1 RNA 2',3'-cyclic phosphodiesterase [Thermoactinomyces sp. CICC 10522]MBH8606951.1 RNA 2',3'-cyclic phosphodiesterase [Thermoactinomyces sp. CICC 10521]
MQRQPEPRLFIAVSLPAGLKRMLADWCEKQSETWAFGKWVNQEDYHITLKFLGNCTPRQIREITEELRGLAAVASPFSLTLAGLGTFGRPASPRILWAGVSGDLPALTSLEQKIGNRLAPLGFPREERPYRPHVTLARKCQMHDFPAPELLQAAWPERLTQTWIVRELILYETKLGKQPMYHAMARFPFR